MKKKEWKKYNNMRCIAWDLIIGMTLLVKKDYIEKPWLNIYIYIYILVGVEFKFLKFR